MEQALSARTLLALGLALAPGLALAKPAPAGPDRAATAALIKQCGDTGAAALRDLGLDNYNEAC